MLRLVISNLLGLAGAAVGGVLGFYIFGWMFERGWYGLMIPGAFLGLGCSMLARHPSLARGIVCGIAALGLGLFAEAWFRPFIADDSFSYFFTHVKDLNVVPTLLMLAIGALIAFWMGKDAGFRGYVRPGQPPRQTTPRQDRPEAVLLDHAAPSGPPEQKGPSQEPPKTA